MIIAHFIFIRIFERDIVELRFFTLCVIEVYDILPILLKLKLDLWRKHRAFYQKLQISHILYQSPYVELGGNLVRSLVVKLYEFILS